MPDDPQVTCTVACRINGCCFPPSSALQCDNESAYHCGALYAAFQALLSHAVEAPSDVRPAAVCVLMAVWLDGSQPCAAWWVCHCCNPTTGEKLMLYLPHA
jgi:hypothetical protein